MRRALLTLGGTVAGIAALVAFKFQPASSAANVAGMPAAGASVSTTGGAGTAAGTGTATGTTAPSSAAAKSPAAKPSAGAKAPVAATPPATSAPPATAAPKPSSSGSTGTSGGTPQSTAARVITGAVDNTQYGPMQVQITVVSKKITKVTVVQETNAGGPSSSIDAMAIPQLNQEALAAQSANINAVSGASYTSAGYKQSLQSAIDQAGL